MSVQMTCRNCTSSIHEFFKNMILDYCVPEYMNAGAQEASTRRRALIQGNLERITQLKDGKISRILASILSFGLQVREYKNAIFHIQRMTPGLASYTFG